jgi:hypothetical protein
MRAWHDAELPADRWTAGSLEELRDEILGWFASASALSREEVLPAYRWLLEVEGGDFANPTVSSIAAGLQRIRHLARLGDSDPAELACYIRHFQRSLATL